MASDPARPLSQAWEARQLVRGAQVATLASVQDGQPFASLVTPGTAPDLSPLLFLSSLAEHTRHLDADGRCSLLFAGSTQEANPQTIPRVTLTGVAARLAGEEAARLKARWLARHPYAQLYAGFGDFAPWRVTIGGVLLVGGFARAVRLKPAQLAPDADSVRAIAEAEADIMEHVNNEHAGAIAAIAINLLQQPAGEWKIVGVDVDGADLATPERACRLHFSSPVSNAAAVRDELVRAAKAARARNE